ncbi:MAG: hypothetical protein N3E40_01375 [Dehalococcoidia bacterium]|nr:hypothetical protein [Dehalococcoidia bacterium]
MVVPVKIGRSATECGFVTGITVSLLSVPVRFPDVISIVFALQEPPSLRLLAMVVGIGVALVAGAVLYLLTRKKK